ncbi:hypothetical protein BHE74_00030472 [Ensete ventricosum]|nr:hypothetical protein BHE74_00030472 [Ensete ventricosum]
MLLTSCISSSNACSKLAPLLWRKGRGRMGAAALVALGEEPEGVDLPDEVGHAGPSAEPEADDEHPPHHEGVHHVHPRPARQEEGRLLRSILQDLEGDLGICLC